MFVYGCFFYREVVHWSSYDGFCLTRTPMFVNCLVAYRLPITPCYAVIDFHDLTLDLINHRTFKTRHTNQLSVTVT